MRLLEGENILQHALTENVNGKDLVRPLWLKFERALRESSNWQDLTCIEAVDTLRSCTTPNLV